MNSLPKLRQEATLLMDSGQIHNIKTFDIAHKYKREINLAENKKNAWVQSLLNPLKLEGKKKKKNMKSFLIPQIFTMLSSAFLYPLPNFHLKTYILNTPCSTHSSFLDRSLEEFF